MAEYHYITAVFLPGMSLFFLTIVAVICCVHYREWGYALFAFGGLALLISHASNTIFISVRGILATVLDYGRFVSIWSKPWGLLMVSLAAIGLIVLWNSEQTRIAHESA